MVLKKKQVEEECWKSNSSDHANSFPYNSLGWGVGRLQGPGCYKEALHAMLKIIVDSTKAIKRSPDSGCFPIYLGFARVASD